MEISEEDYAKLKSMAIYFDVPMCRLGGMAIERLFQFLPVPFLEEEDAQ